MYSDRQFRKFQHLYAPDSGQLLSESPSTPKACAVSTGLGETTRLGNEVLATLRSRGPVKGPDKNGDFKALCPFHDDHSPSLSFHPEKGCFHCFTCHEEGGVRKLAAQLDCAVGIRKSQGSQPRDTKVEATPTLTDRGIRPETIARFAIESDTKLRAWRYPVRLKGQVIAIRWKHFNSKHKPKYWWDKKDERRFFIYGLDELAPTAETLYLVAGEPDCWVCNQAGIAVLTFLGGETTVKKEYFDIIRQHAPAIQTIRVVYDDDNGGIKGANEAVRVGREADFDIQALDISTYNVEKRKGFDIGDLYKKLDCNDDALRSALSELPMLTDDSSSISAPVGELNKDHLRSDCPYSIGGNTIIYTDHKGGRSTVCDMQARITEEITSEGGGRSFRIVGQTNAGLFELEITAERFADERTLKAELTKAAGARAPIYAGMARHLAPAIQMLTGDDLNRTYRHQCTGWANRHFLIPGREIPGIRIELPRKLPYAIDPHANPVLGVEAFESLLQAQRPDIATVAITAFFTAPLAKLCNWRNERYVTFITGKSGSHKTSWVQVAMCLYGSEFIEDHLLLKWGEGATRGAMMSLAAHAHDLPLLIDNYKPTTGGGARDFINLTHSILEGGEKDRLNRTSELRDSKPVFTWPVATGEDVPDNDAASLARILVVPFVRKPGQPNPALDRAQELSPHLCAIGAAWLDWLESDEGRNLADRAKNHFRKCRNQWAERLREWRPDMTNPHRVASNLATSELTWDLMEHCPLISELARKYAKQHADGLIEIAQEMSHQTAESLEASRFLSAIKQLLATGKCVLADRHKAVPTDDSGRVAGIVIGYDGEGEGVYLLPDVARSEVERLLSSQNGLGGISSKTLHKQLDTLEVLGQRDKGRLTLKVRVRDTDNRQTTQNLLHIKERLVEKCDTTHGSDASDVEKSEDNP